MGFSGTRMLSRLFAACEGVDVAHESTGILAPYLDVYAGRVSATAVLRDALGPRFDAADRAGRVPIEVNGTLAYYAHAIRDAWADAEIIHIVRDPRTHVRTMVNLGLHQPETVGRNGNVMRVVPLPGHPAAARWAHATAIEKCALEWRIVHEQAQRARRRHVLRFENLIRDERAFIDLAIRLGVSPCSRATAAALIADTERDRSTARIPTPLPVWATMDPFVRLAIEQIVGPVAWRFGYVEKPA
jgi:hypothetical protein